MKFFLSSKRSASSDENTDKKAAAEQEAACINRNFKVVRVGLSMSFTVFLLLAFSMLYLGAEDPAFYASLMALAANVLLLGGLILLARRTAARYHEWKRENT